VRRTYQNQDVDTSLPALPDTVNLAVAELAGELREGLLALAVGTGMQVLAALMEEDVTAARGPKGRHDPQRRATRHGHERGSVTLGGRPVPVQRPRKLKTWETLTGKVALVTGGIRGIGRAISERLATRGVTIAAGYLRDQEAADEFCADHPGATVHQGNIGSAEDCERVIREVLQAHGKA
jgi:short chain dehydrogenase